MKRAGELLDQIALPGQGEKLVSELSGGRNSASRSRALWPCSRRCVLDEPLSALDLKLRQHMRAELRSIQQQVGITFITSPMIRAKALTMSDRNRGK